jgi:N-acetyl-1-D-myo-inositol-2-amino-2-deoxy-alpha-D-glucopyranoside deacetylase
VLPEGREEPSLAGRTILAVFAHPDDEALACGGTLARLADAGASIVLLCASRGERGFNSDPALVPDGDLGRVRTDELRAASRILGISEVLTFNHPDGSLRWADVSELHAEIVATISRCKPDAIITFDEDGLYWHLDHIGVHERTSTAVLSMGADAPALYYVTMPPGAMRRVVDGAIAKGWAPPLSGLWGIAPDAFGLAAEPPTFSLDVGAWVPRKLAALSCHRTQVGSTNPFSLLNDADARRWLGIEYFRRAQTDGLCHGVLEQFGDPAIMA